MCTANIRFEEGHTPEVRLIASINIAQFKLRGKLNGLLLHAVLTGISDTIVINQGVLEV